MKKTFTLFTAFACSLFSVSAQVDQTFDSIPALTSLTNNCWQFTGASLTTANPAAGTKSLTVYPSAYSNISKIITPYINLTTASTISFAFKLGTGLTPGSKRDLTVQLVTIDGKTTALGTISLNHQSATSLITFSGRSPVTGVQKLVVQLTSTGDPSTLLYIDNINISGTFNYNSPYGCKERGDGALSIHYLKTFQGFLSADKVQLQWTVAENENNSYFEVERSSDGTNFTSIATISATNKIAGESYFYSDPIQTRAYYRLKVVSKTNIRMYSNVVSFKTGSVSSAGLSVLQNPVQQSLKIGFVADSKTAALLSVYNSSGIRVFQTSFLTGKGYNVVSTGLDAQLKKGNYFLEVTYAASRSTVQFIKE